MLVPFASRFGEVAKRKNIVYITALGTLLSFAFIYPTPVTIPLIASFSPGLSTVWYDAVALTVSIFLLVGIILFYQAFFGKNDDISDFGITKANGSMNWDHVRAWLPFIVIVLAVPAGLFLALSQATLVQFVMLAGVACALIVASPTYRSVGLAQGAKHGGVIIFDICGAGALGYVIIQGGFSAGILSGINGIVPVLCVPFLLAALIQTAQGSRVVTAVITGDILAGAGFAATIHPIFLVLMVAAGTCVVSYVTDPYFWLIQRSTGDEIGTVVKKYTLPLATAGLAVFLIAAGLQVALF